MYNDSPIEPNTLSYEETSIILLILAFHALTFFMVHSQKLSLNSLKRKQLQKKKKKIIARQKIRYDAAVFQYEAGNRLDIDMNLSIN